jgi:hypothetical protein
MTTDDFYPDGLTTEAITALQRDVTRELHREGYPARCGQRPVTPPAHDPGHSFTELPSGAATEPPGSSASPLPDGHNHPDGPGTDDGDRSSTGQPTADPPPLLFTPAQAADLLQIPESWLRRSAARRTVPCTFLGKHLRFSPANLNKIVADATRPATTHHTGPGAPGRRRTRRRGPTHGHPRRPPATHTRSADD